MKVIRRSPVTRVTAWLLTSALITPTLAVGSAAKAQDSQVLKILITDAENRAAPVSPELGRIATAAEYNEFGSSGLNKYNVISPSEVRNEAQTLGLPVPSSPTAPFNYSDTDWLRIAKSLGADDIVSSQVNATHYTEGKAVGVRVGMLITFKEVGSSILTNGGYADQIELARPGETPNFEEQLNKGVEDAALKSVGMAISHQVVQPTVLNINDQTVIFNRGLRDGIQVGDKIQILRESATGSKYVVGEAVIARSYASDSEAQVLKNIAGIRPEDIGAVVYTPPVTIPWITSPVVKNGGPKAVPHSAAFSLAAIGGTLSVIGIGVLVAAATHNGQQSIENLTAEATSQQSSAAVLVRWNDNLFGQGNVQQYHIYRLPDFPYSSILSSTGTGNTGGGNGTTNYAIPVDVVAGVTHSYTDLPSPHLPYANGGIVLEGSSNGGLGSSAGSGGGNNNNGGNTTTGGAFVPPATTDTGFTPGKQYYYQVTAIILRQVPSSTNSNTNGGTGGVGGGGIGGGGTGGIGGGGTGGTGGNGNGNTGSTEYIETDPSTSGLVTPVTPVQLSSPAPAAGNISVTAFSPVWGSTVGADVFDVEVSLDRTFSNPNLIYHTGEIVSTAPLASGVAQSLQAPIDLAVQPQLLANPQFAAFVAQGNGVAATSPLIYWRVGARSDEDSPGPVNWISKNSNDPDRTFRWVYTVPQYFTAAPVPPAPPTTSKAAKMLNQQYTTRGLLTPLIGNGKSTSSSHVLTPQEILTGHGRIRN